MNDSSKRVKPSSIAAFLFMPQFHLSFQHFSFIVPVFIRTVAMVFEQAGLLPPNHPAARYGMEGVRKYKFMELMGEAWYTLRSTQANPYQWGLFASVVLMITFTILSVITTLLNLSSIFIGTATAQIFDHPTGGATNSASVTGAGYTSAGMFDKSLATGGAHQDYGIMMIDKLFRQGAEGIGGPLQKALGGLMEIYNTGVLVIAGILLFWIIISVVVDTAKTGHLGGQRHNMVWAPIRIVFALGLMIPLGTQGYSSGQFLIMKLAEWGSNFGTRGWVEYVNGVASNTALMVTAAPKNMTTLVSEYEKMWLCRVAYNGYTQQSTGGLPPAQKITTVDETGVYDFGSKTIKFTNDTAANICGTITYQTPEDPALKFSLSGDGDPIGKALANYKGAVMQAYSDLFVGTPDGTLAADAEKFACAFVSQHIFAGGGGGDPLAAAGCGATAVCGAGAPGSGQYPDMSCMAAMIASAYTPVNAKIQAEYANLQAVLDANLLKEVQIKGWAGMGRWYHQISSMNHGIMSVETSSVSITGGEYNSMAATIGSAHVAKINEVLGQYDTWWQTVSTTTPVTGGVPSPPGETPADKPEATGIYAKLKSLASSITSANSLGFTAAVVDVVFSGVDQGYFVFDIAKPSEPNTYPLAELTKAGHQIQALGIGMIGTIALSQAILGLLDSTVGAFGFTINLGDFGTTTAGSILFQVLGTVGTTLVLSGTLLAVYVPLIPFVRTIFSVLTWMVSVFEAVVMIPIAALAHLHTDGEGLAGSAKQIWVLWLNVLMRPMLTVIGFVASLLIFNTFVIYFHDMWTKLTIATLTKDGIKGIFAIFSNTILYVGIIYTAANATFKLLDLIPNALIKYMGGHVDHSFDSESSAAEGFISAGGQYASKLGGSIADIASRPRPAKPGRGATDLTGAPN